MSDINDIEITREMMETVAMAQLYRDEPIISLSKVVKQRLNNSEMALLYKRILQHPDFQAIKDDAIKLEELTLVDDNINTIMLYYNKLLKEAQFEKKYEVVARILKEIRQLKAIENEQMKFEIVIKRDERKNVETENNDNNKQ